MKPIKNFQDVILLIVAISPLIYLAIIWKTIPAIVPQHFDGHFKPDAYGNKSFLLFPCFLFSALAIGIYFLFKNIHKIDPLRYGAQKKDGMVKFGLGIGVVLTVLSFIIILSSAKNVRIGERLLLPVIGLLFALIGNYMQNLKPNYFAGIRVPWTLNSAENWRKTHQMAGKLWFGGGLLIALLTALVPPSIGSTIMLIITGALVIVPIRFSYLFFKKEKNAL